MIALILFNAIEGLSQIEGPTFGMVSLSALAYQNVEQDLFSSLNIISSSSNVNKIQFGVYTENRFMTKGLNKIQSALSFPFKKSGAGIMADYQGMNKMNYIGVAGGYGMELSNKINIGLKIEAGRSAYPSGNKSYLIGYQTGFIFKANEKTQFGLHLTNRFFFFPTKSLNKPGTYIINAGIGHTLNEMLYLSCEIIKAKNTNTYISPYIKWHINNSLQLHGGVLSSLNTGYIGLGWKKSTEFINLSFASHNYLGISGSISIVHEFN